MDFFSPIAGLHEKKTEYFLTTLGESTGSRCIVVIKLMKLYFCNEVFIINAYLKIPCEHIKSF